jgi:hypothetical protein
MTLPLSKAEAHCTTAVTPLLQLISGRDCIPDQGPSCVSEGKGSKADGTHLYWRRISAMLPNGHHPPWNSRHSSCLNSCSTRRREPRQRALNTGASRDQTSLEIAPQRHQELTGERHDGNAAHPPLAVADAPTEPGAQGMPGWYRSHIQASSIRVVRTMELPDLLMPWSRSIDPLDQGLGAMPAKLASWRRLAKDR